MEKYLSQGLPFPTNLTKLDAHFEELVSKHRSPYGSNRPHKATLLTTSSTIENYANREYFWHVEVPDAKNIPLTFDGIENHLSRLIAPDELAEARPVICECLGITRLSETVGILFELASRFPDIVAALLNLRYGHAASLIKQYATSIETSQDNRNYLSFSKHIPEEIARIGVAFFLRIEALKAGNQINHPFNWFALDGLEIENNGGTLRAFTMITEVSDNLRLINNVLDLHKATTSQPIATGLLVQNPVANAGGSTVTFSRCPTADARLFCDNDLVLQAHRLLETWRAEHGVQLEGILDRTIVEIRRSLARLRKHLTPYFKSTSHNSIVGNLRRADAGERLYQAVAEAIAWTKDPTPAESSDGQEDETKPEHGANPLATAIETALREGRSALGKIPVPASDPTHREMTVELFAALRIAFLQDDEVLPRKLRTIVDPASGKTVTHKCHRRIASMRKEGAYTFNEQWAAYNEAEADKRSRAASKTNSDNAISEAKRGRPNASRGDEAARGARIFPPFGLFKSKYALRANIFRGFATP